MLQWIVTSMRWLNGTFFTTRPALTRRRVGLAFLAGVATDALQLLLGPLGWAGADEILDVAATAITTKLLGFHPLLLPTFVLEFLPVTDVLPTWTACVAIVVSLRRRELSSVPPPVNGPVIDV